MITAPDRLRGPVDAEGSGDVHSAEALRLQFAPVRAACHSAAGTDDRARRIGLIFTAADTLPDHLSHDSNLPEVPTSAAPLIWLKNLSHAADELTGLIVLPLEVMTASG